MYITYDYDLLINKYNIQYRMSFFSFFGISDQILFAKLAVTTEHNHLHGVNFRTCIIMTKFK